jgi:sugar/nucleoside kinase (ribokinase family)
MLPKDAAKLVADIDAVLVDNRFPQFVTEVCRAAQVRKIPIVIDLDQETKVKDPLLALGTHVISSTEALFATTGYEDYGRALKALAEHLSGFLALTDGPNGVYWLEGSELRHLPAFKIKVVDSLGAGDAFHAGFTLALAEGRALPDILRFASATAALKCTKFGGGSSAPTRTEVEEFLKKNN